MQVALRPIGLLGLVVIAYALWPGLFPLDDAYITLHNARVLLSGVPDPLYGGSPLTGATSAVHLALVALVGLILPLTAAGFFVSAGAAVLYGLGLARLIANAGVSGWQRAALIFVGLFASFLPVQFANGLETSLAMAAVAWGLALADDRRLPLLCGASPFIRPELAFLAAPLMLRQLWAVRHDVRAAAAKVGLAIAAALPWCLWYLIETGLPFPNTAGAKIVFFAQAMFPLGERFEFWSRALAISLLLPLFPAAAGLGRVRAGWCGAVFGATWLLLGLLTLPSSLAFNDARYLAPLVPVLVHGLAGLCGSTRLGSWYLLALVPYSLFTGAMGLSRLQVSIFGEPRIWAPAADFVRDHVPPGSVVLVHDAGWVAWKEPKVRLVDVVGLKTPESAKVHARFRSRDCQWGPALSHIAAANRATHLMVLQQPFWDCVGTNLQEQGWRLTPVFADPGGFSVFRIAPPSVQARPSAATWSSASAKRPPHAAVVESRT